MTGKRRGGHRATPGDFRGRRNECQKLKGGRRRGGDGKQVLGLGTGREKGVLERGSSSVRTFGIDTVRRSSQLDTKALYLSAGKKRRERPILNQNNRLRRDKWRARALEFVLLQCKKGRGRLRQSGGEERRSSTDSSGPAEHRRHQSSLKGRR